MIRQSQRMAMSRMLGGTLLAALYAAQANVGIAQSRQSGIQKRTYTFKEAGDKQMEFALFVPSGYDKRKPAPLIVALHGLFSTPQQIMRYPGFTRHAEKHGYIIVAPMGYNRWGWYGSRGKGGGRRSSDPENLGELSEQDVINVLAIVRKEFHVDPDRTYLLGHSMGGSGTWHLAIKYPAVWAALAPLAPAGPRSRRGLKRIAHIPVIVVQGDRDFLVRGTRRWVAGMKELKMKHKYIEVKGGDHIRPAYQHFPEIFAFFNANPRRPSRPVVAPRPKRGGRKSSTAMPPGR